MEALTLATIAAFAGGTLTRGEPARPVRGVTTDSRAVKPGELFVALEGERFDGHHFVDACARAGAAGAVVARSWVGSKLADDFALVAVDDTLRAYQRIASEYRGTLPARVLAITGSNGKTSTKDLCAAVLARRFRVAKTRGNLNNHVGVPQTLLGLSRDDEVAVLELGMNHPGEIAPLAAIARPDAAIITNIGSAHIEYMKTREAIALEKGRLAEALAPSGHLIMPVDDEFTAAIAQRTRARLVTVGFQRGDVRAEMISEGVRGTSFWIIDEADRLEAYLPIPGAHMVANALLAVAAGRIHGVSLAECVEGLGGVQLTKGRLELKSVAGLQVIDDTYNANPDSMLAALKTLARMPAGGRRIAVLGRMGELGDFSESGHRQVGDAAAREGIDCLVTVGSEAGVIARSASANGLREVAAVASVAEAADFLAELARPDDLILIKGSRSAAMENILPELAARRASPAEPRVP